MAESPPEKPAGKPRIMIVDDEVDITQVLTMALERSGFVSDSFNDPLKALESFGPGHYDMVLLDIRMPVMNGFELYREIRKLDAKVQICFLTAHENYAMEFNAVYFEEMLECVIKKPAKMMNVVKIVSERLGIRQP
jgi:DNA-binding response OmpR family regulator